MRTTIQKNLVLTAMVAVAVLTMSGCCSDKHCKSCHCMDKNMSGKMMHDGKMMHNGKMMHDGKMMNDGSMMPAQ